MMAKERRLGEIDEAKEELFGGGMDTKGRHGGSVKASKRESRARPRRRREYRVQVLRSCCTCYGLCHTNR